ncbi:polysaccharide deacetylase family protein [Streptomyces sp. NPDC051907]|uniref:polysaccharide deacetylase family protein n=1 Tax=Streptomyces sp. NPDC051907 TaxID=3155284 RepID=UPI003447747A
MRARRGTVTAAAGVLSVLALAGLMQAGDSPRTATATRGGHGAVSTDLASEAGGARRPRSPGTAPSDDTAALKALFGDEIRRMPTEKQVVALTFNAAWNEAGVDSVLAELRRRKLPATFFLTGEFAEAHPAAARAMAAEHGIGNHSYSHPQFADISEQEQAREVQEADAAIRAATGATPLPFFRFPYSATTPQTIAAVNALGYADIEFTADTNGYLGPDGGMTVEKALDRALDAAVPGGILQMHVGNSGSGPVLDADALPQIIDAVEDRGYQIVDLRTLLDPAAQQSRRSTAGGGRHLSE